MKKLVLGTLMTAALLQAGTGCIISGDDDDDVVVDDGDDGGAGILYQVDWVCPIDADSITFTITPVGSSTSLDPDTFPCADGTADILVDPGSYDVDVTPEGDIGTFASLTDTLDGADGDLIQATFDTFPDDGGFFLLTWSIDGADPAASCADVGADRVAIDGTLLDTSELFTDEFPCEDGVGITDFDPAGWPIGEYVLDVSLIDAAGDPISDAAPIGDVFIDFADQLSDVGDVDFETAP